MNSPDGLRAILADPDDDARVALATQFASSGWLVDDTDDGRVALAKALAIPPSLIVATMKLPGMSGAQLTTVLRADPATALVPIVLIDAEEDRLENLQRAGADMVFVRPLDSTALMLEIQRLLARSTKLRDEGYRTRARAHRQLERSAALIRESARHHERAKAMSRTLARVHTTHPSLVPPPLSCPQCDCALLYQYSYEGGVNERQLEQWDYFECRSGCGAFQFRHRTNTLKKIAQVAV